MWVHVLFMFASAGCGDGDLAVFGQKTQAITYCFRINRTASRYYMNVVGLSQVLIRIAGARNGLLRKKTSFIKSGHSEKYSGL